MKSFEEIRSDKRFIPKQKGIDGGNGWVTLKGKSLYVIYSNGGNWEHVSASMHDRCPTWEEMCTIKDIFFKDDECCVEYHPKKSDYVNVHPYCLHIWRPIGVEIPTPPTSFV